MASVQISNEPVPGLMAAVKRLTPAELRDFTTSFLAWQRETGDATDSEVELLQLCRLRLAKGQERRLKTLIGKSETQELRSNELQEYRNLVREAEKLDAVRVAALAQLARLWDKPLGAVIKRVGWECGDETATRNPARRAKARARPRR